MTNIEQRALNQIISECQKYLKEEDKWEQRRYEIARDLYVRNVNASAEECVRWADELIEELKKGGPVSNE